MLRWRAVSRIRRGGMPQPTCLPLPMRAAAGSGQEVEPGARAATANAPPSATTMVEVAINSSNTHNRCIQGSGSAHSKINNRCPYGSRSRGDIRSRSSGDIRSISWVKPLSQQQYRSGAPHQRRQHWGHQSHWHQQRTCQRCGEEEHFPAECRATRNTPVPAAPPYPYSAPSPGAHVAQYGSFPPPPWTSYEYSDGRSIASSFGPPPPSASYAPAPPMPSPPGHHGLLPPAPSSDSDWSFSSGYSQALQAHFVQPGEFSESSVLSDSSSQGGGVCGSYIPSAFVG